MDSSESNSRRGEKPAIITAIILYLAALFSLAFISDASIFLVFIGTMPVLLYLATFFYLIRIDSRMGLLWVLPLLFPLLFLFLWYSSLAPWLKVMDGQVVAVLDVIMSYLINIFVLFIFGIGNRRKPDQKLQKNIGEVKHQIDSLKSQLEKAHTELSETKNKLYEVKRELTVNKENFNITLRSIEDKCKAINFVIGRVYSDKKGASESVRERLRISSDLYNSFSEITADFKSEDAHKLSIVLKNIHHKLLDLELPENRVIKIGIAQLPVDRDPLGSYRVIDVLKRNDKDPVEDYHNEAKEVCSKLLVFLNENYLKSNTYFSE